MLITVNGEKLTLYRTVAAPHGFTDLIVGRNQAEKRVSVPDHIYRNGGTVFTSGNRITVPKGNNSD